MTKIRFYIYTPKYYYFCYHKTIHNYLAYAGKNTATLSFKAT
jgi:hypothetical protein